MIKVDLPDDLVIKMDLTKMEPFPLDVPCLNGLGSCEYDFCKILVDNGDQLCDQMPEGQPCGCPLLQNLQKSYSHEPRPFRQGTSNGNGSIFVRSILITRSSGKSTLIKLWISMVISPGMGISSGLLPPITTKSASSYPSQFFGADLSTALL